MLLGRMQEEDSKEILQEHVVKLHLFSLVLNYQLSLALGSFSLDCSLILSAIPVIFQRIRHLRALANNANDYSFNSFGIFWGVSTTLFVCAITIICSDLWFLIKLFHNLGAAMQVVWVLCITILFLLTTAALFSLQ